MMARTHKKRNKKKKITHNLKDTHRKNKIKGRGYDDPAEQVIKKTKKQKQDKKQQIKKVDIKKDTKKRKK
jgi:hypothetical protein